MNQLRPIAGARVRIGHSACPHDCPSTCAVDVELLGPERIGRVRGASDNSYTAGVICAKVARYAERVHHPGRLLKPLVRKGGKGEGKWREASWEAALFGTNITDERAIQGMLSFLNLFGTVETTYVRPEEWALSIQKHF